MPSLSLSIQEILATLDGKDLTNFEKKRLNDEMAGVVTSIWDSDDLRRKKPTPVDGTYSVFDFYGVRF